MRFSQNHIYKALAYCEPMSQHRLEEKRTYSLVIFLERELFGCIWVFSFVGVFLCHYCNLFFFFFFFFFFLKKSETFS